MLFPKAQVVQAAAGGETSADGLAKIQLAAVGPCLAVGRELPVDLTGNRLDHGNGFGNLRILEFPNIPVQKPHFRILLLHPGPGVFHTHLLLQQRLRKYGVDEFTV